jgi:hypothetical protein
MKYKKCHKPNWQSEHYKIGFRCHYSPTLRKYISLDAEAAVSLVWE